MYVSARSDYALRALIALAAEGRPMTAEQLAASQDLPISYLEAILIDLRRGGIVASRRGPDAGYRFVRPAKELTPADVMRAVEGPLAEVRGPTTGGDLLHGVGRAPPGALDRAPARAFATCSKGSRSTSWRAASCPRTFGGSCRTPTPGCRTDPRTAQSPGVSRTWFASHWKARDPKIDGTHRRCEP